MPFHVEIRRSHRRAWAFNLDETKLRRTVLDPWRRGRPVVLGDREWEPEEGSLRILEGPELSPQDLAYGQGWHNAERSAEEATASIMSRAATEATAVAVLAETSAGQRSVTDVLQQLEIRAADWAAVRSRVVAAATAVEQPTLDGVEVVAAVLVVEGSEPARSWLFEAGLALGALGGRAIVAQLGAEPPPPELRDLAAIRLEPGEPGSLQALAELLRRAPGASP
jgi:hypothetical protein